MLADPSEFYITAISSALTEYVTGLPDLLINPQKRLFIGYLFAAFFVAVIWLVFFEKLRIKQVLSRCFSKSIWWSTSSRLDYQLLLVNRFLFLILSPYLLAQMTVAGALFFQLHECFPARPQGLTQWSDYSVGVLFTLAFFIFDDFSRFYVHRLMHRIPLLWAFHKVHHSAEVLTPLTVLRTHPVEGVLFTLRTVLVQAVMIASFIFFFGERVTLVTVLGANFITVVFNMMGSNLRHSPIAVRYPRLIEKWFFSPAQHHIHHSVNHLHHDKNFGVFIALWDRLGHSFMHSQEANGDQTQLTFGLDNEQHQNLIQAYINPFKESASLVSSILFDTKKYITSFNFLSKPSLNTSNLLESSKVVKSRHYE